MRTFFELAELLVARTCVKLFQDNKYSRCASTAVLRPPTVPLTTDERLDKACIRPHGLVTVWSRLVPLNVIPVPDAAVVPHHSLEQSRTRAQY